MDLCLRGGRVVLPDRVAAGHSVWVADGHVVTVAPDGAIEAGPGVTVVDVTGRLVGPGFVDLLCHGGGGVWTTEDPVAASDYHLAHGTTSMLAATALLATHEENLRAVATIADAVAAGRTRNVEGIHMEGPYLNPDFGAYREWSRLPVREEYLGFVDAARGLLRTMTIAPELEGAAGLVHGLQEATGGRMVFSVGHSRATRHQIEALVPGGLRLATHLMNASGANPDPARYAGTREVGVDEAVLLDDGMWAAVIADAAGRHVRPDLVRLIVKVKGADRVVAVTDCTAAHGAPVGGASGGPEDINYNDRGEIAGSALTMDAAVANLARHADLPVETAWRMASHNPAAALGLLDRVGQLLPGRRANIVVADDDLIVEQVWLDGVLIDRGQRA